MKKRWIAEFCATVAFIGKSRYIPGTLGSIPALFIVPNSGIVIYILIFILISIIGVISIECYENRDQDPREIVIDEIIGQMIAIFVIKIANVEISWKILVMLFLMFRFFDIIKPWPISLIDQNMKNTAGIILDDVVAGVFAGFISLLFVWLFW